MKDTALRLAFKARKNVKYDFGATTVAGTGTIEARHEDCPLPLATIWWRTVGNGTIEIMGMYTISWARKCGLQGWLFERLLHHHPDVKRIITASDTRYSREWLKKRGFKRNEERDLELVINRKGKQ